MGDLRIPDRLSYLFLREWDSLSEQEQGLCLLLVSRQVYYHSSFDVNHPSVREQMKNNLIWILDEAYRECPDYPLGYLRLRGAIAQKDFQSDPRLACFEETYLKMAKEENPNFDE